MTGQITVHLRAADGAALDLTIPAPAIRTARVRVAAVRADTVQAGWAWDGSRWVKNRRET